MIQFSHSVVSHSLRPYELQHTRPSPAVHTSEPGVHSNSCPSSRWCHPAISSFVIPFSSYQQSFPALGSFPTSQFFASGGQSIGASASASASVLPMDILGWFPLGLTGLTLCCLRNSQESSPAPQFKSINSLAGTQPSLWPNSHICTWLLEKP